ncbi:MAG: hypothetical protein ABR588_05895 [Sphingomicrobium sp.]|nr:hypothetical protein [Sphingomonadales bacterium]
MARLPGALGTNLDAFGSAVTPNQPTVDPLAPLPAAVVPINGAKPPLGTPPFALPHPDTGGAQQTTALSPAVQPHGVGEILAQLLNQHAAPQHGLMGFLDRVANPTNALGQIGQALLAASGGPIGNAVTLLQDQHQRAGQAALQQQHYAIEQMQHDQGRQDQLDERTYQHNKPEFFSGKDDRVKYDPITGTASTVYDAPTEAQTYAGTLGYTEGTPDYNKAVEDYTLRNNGPTALQGLLTLEGARFGDRTKLEDQRAGNRSSLEEQRAGNRTDLKGTATYRDMHPPAPGSLGPPRTTGNVYAPIIAKVARGEPLTPGEQQAMAMRGAHGRYSGPTGVADGATATGPNGQKIVLRGGRWVPVR